MRCLWRQLEFPIGYPIMVRWPSLTRHHHDRVTYDNFFHWLHGYLICKLNLLNSSNSMKEFRKNYIILRHYSNDSFVRKNNTHVCQLRFVSVRWEEQPFSWMWNFSPQSGGLLLLSSTQEWPHMVIHMPRETPPVCTRRICRPHSSSLKHTKYRIRQENT